MKFFFLKKTEDSFIKNLEDKCQKLLLSSLENNVNFNSDENNVPLMMTSEQVNLSKKQNEIEKVFTFQCC